MILQSSGNTHTREGKRCASNFSPLLGHDDAHSTGPLVSRHARAGMAEEQPPTTRKRKRPPTCKQQPEAQAFDFLLFDAALAVARSLGLFSETEWREWCRSGVRPANMPATPSKVYKHTGWQGWGHWLGTGNKRSKEFVPFTEALACARSLQLGSEKDWRLWSKSSMRPPNVPSKPYVVYKHHGWRGWGHWLGSNNLTTKSFLPFEEARQQCRHLQLNTSTEWKVWRTSGARPANVPSAPDQIYKHDGWRGWEHWLWRGRFNVPA